MGHDGLSESTFVPCAATSFAAVREPPSRETPKPRLLDQVRMAIRSRHYSPRTEEAYVRWIRRFILFHGSGTPEKWGRARSRGSCRASP